MYIVARLWRKVVHENRLSHTGVQMLSATLCVLAMAVLWCNGAAYAHGDHEATFFHRQDITHHEVLGDDRAIVEPMPAAGTVHPQEAYVGIYARTSPAKA